MDGWDAVDELGKVAEGRWKKLAADTKEAVCVITGCGAVAVLGVPVVSIFLGGGAIPPAKHFAAALFLLVIALPVAAAVGVAGYSTVPPPRVSSGPALLLLCAIASLLGIAVMTEVVGDGLAGFYCYNDGLVQETACRQFNEAGFFSSGVRLGSPGDNAKFLVAVLVFMIDARGWIIVASGGLAGFYTGKLIRLAQGR